HRARPARHRADRDGLQPGDRRLLARRRRPVDRGRPARARGRGGDDRGQPGRHAGRHRSRRQRPRPPGRDRGADAARGAHDRRGAIGPAMSAPNTMIGLRMPELDVWSERGTVALGGNPSLFTGPGTNTYLVGTGRARILLDPGQGVPGYLDVLERAMARAGCDALQEIVLTHGHVDHIGGVAQVLERFGPLRVSKLPWPE